MVTLDDIRLAQQRLRGIAIHTPLIRSLHSPQFEASSNGAQLWFKPESLQPVGSFKLRGACNKILSLTDEERRRGVIAHSSGNHAQGVAYAAKMLGIRAVIVMPCRAPRIKIDGTASLGAEIVFVGPASSERAAKAAELARERGLVPVPPFNDEKIIAGQGTLGLEIVADMPDVECVLVPVSGGGLISGTATAIKLTNPAVKVIGIEPDSAADAQASLRTGHIVELPSEQTEHTMCDGLRAQHLGEIPWEHLRRYVDDILTVSEDEIREAVRHMILKSKLVTEPSGAVGLAAFLFHGQQLPKVSRTVAVISGGNMEPQLLAEIMREEEEDA